METNDLISKFGKLIIDARDSGLHSLNTYIEGRRLKKPEKKLQDLYDLIETLDDKQKDELCNGVEYLIDLSLFKLLSLFEDTKIKDFTVELKIKQGENELYLVREDHESHITEKYWWEWLKNM